MIINTSTKFIIFLIGESSSEEEHQAFTHAIDDNGNEEGQETDLQNVNPTVSVPANTTSDVTTIQSENATVVHGDQRVLHGNMFQAERNVVINVGRGN